MQVCVVEHGRVLKRSYEDGEGRQEAEQGSVLITRMEGDRVNGSAVL